MAELFRNAWWLVHQDVGAPYARLVRTGTPFSDMSEAGRATQDLLPALRGFKRLLLDFRGGPPGRNDAEFENASEAWRKTLSRAFDKRAVLVKSAAGKLQVKRLNDAADGFLVTQSEDEAIRFLSDD